REEALQQHVARIDLAVRGDLPEIRRQGRRAAFQVKCRRLSGSRAAPGHEEIMQLDPLAPGTLCQIRCRAACHRCQEACLLRLYFMIEPWRPLRSRSSVKVSPLGPWRWARMAPISAWSWALKVRSVMRALAARWARLRAPTITAATCGLSSMARLA